MECDHYNDKIKEDEIDWECRMHGREEEYILWRTDPLLHNDHETNNEATPAARQQILNKQQLNYNSEERCFLCGPCQNVISGTSESCSYSVSEEKTRRLL
jgi:hypothetical protein